MEDKITKTYNLVQLLLLPLLLIDQGLADQFYPEQLKTEIFASLCEEKNLPVTIRFHDGYDHSYYFIATFMEDHLNFHHKHLA